MPVTVWSNPRGSGSRGALGLLAERGVEVDEVRYLDVPPPVEEIERVLRLLGYADPREGLVRTGEPAYRGLGLGHAPRGVAGAAARGYAAGTASSTTGASVAGE